MNTVKDEIAKNLIRFRKRNKMTQRDLAKRLDVRDNTISQWENGINSIDMGTLADICKIFNVSVSEMFGRFANTSTDDYSYEEKNIISNFRDLNEAGKTYAVKQLSFALSQDEYKKNNNVQNTGGVL